ncbi:MAG: magnesium transporter [Archaeoglobaceae archaeon]
MALETLKSAWKLSFPTLLLCLALDFVPGMALGVNFENIITSYPILLVALPGLMGMRGNIFGALASRFTTSLYLGEMEPSLKDRRVYEGLTLSISLAILPVVILWFIGGIKTEFLNFLPAFAILIASTIFACLILGFTTSLVTVVPFRKNLDPDLLATPTITSVADLVTIPTLILFMVLFEVNDKIVILSAFSFLVLFFVMLFYFRPSKKVFLEVGIALSFLALLSSVTGSILESFSEKIYEVFILTVLYPAILDSLGNYGCIIGSKTSTRLHMGEINHVIDKKSFEYILSLLTTSLALSVIIFLIGVVVSSILGREAELTLIFFFLYPTIALLVMLLAHFFAVFAYRHNLDPDNVTIPTITTLTDLIATAFVILLAFL